MYNRFSFDHADGHSLFTKFVINEIVYIIWNHAERIYWTSAKFLESKQDSCLQEQSARDKTKNAGENGDTLIPLFTVCKYFF